MSSILLDLSGKVDPGKVDAIAAVSSVASRSGIPFLIVGATCRDLLLECACGIRTGRASEDVDFGVRVNTWDEFELLARHLMQSSGFLRDKRKGHRFYTGDDLIVDLVPFGPIAGSRQHVTWPPAYDREMSVEGFDTALTNAVEILLRKDPQLVVRTASLPGLALMKLISWDDSNPARARDAHDLFVIANSYMETAALDRLSTDAKDLANKPMASLQEIGARLLGRDMAIIAEIPTGDRIAAVLHRESTADGPLKMVTAMRSAAGPLTSADEILALLKAVEEGFSETRGKT